MRASDVPLRASTTTPVPVDAAGLAQLARMLGLAIPQDALDRLAPAVSKVYADLDRLRDLPLDDRRPALPPLADLSPAPETRR